MSHLILGSANPALSPCCQSLRRAQLLRLREETAKVIFLNIDEPFLFCFFLTANVIFHFYMQWHCFGVDPVKILGRHTGHIRLDLPQFWWLSRESHYFTCVQSLLQSLPRKQMRRRRLRRRGRVGGRPASSCPPPTPSCQFSSSTLITFLSSHWVFGQKHEKSGFYREGM